MFCIDIETIRAFDIVGPEIDEDIFQAWESYSERKFPGMDIQETFKEHAALLPEYSKVVSITLKNGGNDLTSAACKYGAANMNEAPDGVPFFDTEADLLNWLSSTVGQNPKLLGHYIKKFDLPFLAVRFVTNKIKLPKWLKMYGVKPWEMGHIIDTWEVWKSGVYGASGAGNIESICACLGIQSPKSEFSGKDVGGYFYSEEPDRLHKIVKYCERDVLATSLLANRMFQMGMI